MGERRSHLLSFVLVNDWRSLELQRVLVEEVRTCVSLCRFALERNDEQWHLHHGYDLDAGGLRGANLVAKFSRRVVLGPIRDLNHAFFDKSVERVGNRVHGGESGEFLWKVKNEVHHEDESIVGSIVVPSVGYSVGLALDAPTVSIFDPTVDFGNDHTM
jgi:hypothetical protein